MTNNTTRTDSQPMDKETLEIIELNRVISTREQDDIDAMLLADELGRIKAELSRLQKTERKVKGLLIEHCRKYDISAVDGLDYRATVSEGSRTTLDAAKIKKLVPASILAKVQKVSEFVTVRCTSLRTS